MSSRDMQVGRALRSEHARARPAYPRDPLGLRSTRHTRPSHLAASPCVHRSILPLPRRATADTLQARGTVMLPSLSRAIPLEPAHDLGRLGLLLAEMRAMVCRGFYDSLALWSAGAVRVLVACVVPLRFDGCSWHVRCTSSPALWSQLMVFDGSDMFVRRCARWCMAWFVVRS